MKAKAKSKAAVAVATLFGRARYEALLSPDQIMLACELVDVIAEGKVRSHDMQSLCRSIIGRTFPAGHEPDKATWVEFVGGIADDVADLCFRTIAPSADETEQAAAKRFNGLRLYASECVRKAYKEPEQDDGSIGTRDLPDAGNKVAGAVPPGMNIGKVTKGFASKVRGATDYAAKLADYPFDGAMLIEVAKWAESTLAMLAKLEADAKASAGEKAA